MELKKECVICGKTYFKTKSTGMPEWGRKKYCSKECQHKSLLKSPLIRTCGVCGKEYRRQNGYHEQKFCSMKCAGKGTDWTKRPQYIPEAHDGSTVLCACGCGTVLPMYSKKFLRVTWVEGHQSIGKKKPKTPEQIEKQRETIIKNGKQKGDKHWNWKGGITDPMKSLRRTKEYDDWRFAVYKKNNYVCQHCGVKTTSKTIAAHHIEGFRENTLLRYDVDNGITLCRKCHIRTHKPS